LNLILLYYLTNPQAVSVDPFAGSMLTLPRIREMVEEMLEAEKKWLPQFK
jgi:alpha-galactosidase/6-phospho-beta-glucosidase family protein